MVKQESRRTATRSAIVAAAFEAFGHEGYADVSVDVIAARAGVAKGAVYHHFASKKAVFEAVLESISSGILREVTAAIPIGGTFREVFAIGNRAFFVGCSDPARSRILLHDGPAVLGWERWRRIDERHFGGAVRLALMRAMDEGTLVRNDVEAVSRVMLGAITEAAIACAEAEDFMACADRYLDVLALMVEGLAVDPA